MGKIHFKLPELPYNLTNPPQTLKSLNLDPWTFNCNQFKPFSQFLPLKQNNNNNKKEPFFEKNGSQGGPTVG